MRLYAGDTFYYSVPTTEYTSDDGYSGRCSFTNAYTAYTAETIVYSGGEWHYTISAADTADYESGDYTALFFAYNGENRYRIDSFMLTILPDPMTQPADLRTTARQILDAIDACLTNSATIAQQNISIGGKAIGKYSLTDLMSLRDKYAEMVRNEEHSDRVARGVAPSNQFYIRFGS
jgi:hypothetical protein